AVTLGDKGAGGNDGNRLLDSTSNLDRGKHVRLEQTLGIVYEAAHSYDSSRWIHGWTDEGDVGRKNPVWVGGNAHFDWRPQVNHCYITLVNISQNPERREIRD